MASVNPPLLPRNGKVLQVLIVARISTIHQDSRSLVEQELLCRQYVATHFKGEINYQIISSRGSGEILDRKELNDAEALVESDVLDLVVVEDLARLSRRNRAIDFCELCEDHYTRFIGINDHLDSAREDWRVNGLIASFQHEQHNAKASRRLKDRLRERFKTGGALSCLIFGYRKPPGANLDNQLEKDPAAEPIYEEWFRLLEDGASFSEVADWLNNQGIAPGPYCRLKRWDGRMVARVSFNPILKGLRVRNRKESRRINKTGRRRSVNAAPQQLLQRSCPTLGFIEPERYDRVCDLLQAKNAEYARGRLRKQIDSRKGVSKKRTVWPGQHLRCGICSRLMYWGGHGIASHMMCSGNRDYRCWMGATFDGFDAARRISRAILLEIESLPEFDQIFLEKVRSRIEKRRSTKGNELDEVVQELLDVEQERGRITEAIAKAGPIDILVDKLNCLTAQRNELRTRKTLLERVPTTTFSLPTMGAIRQLARDSIGSVAITSPEFGRVMHRLVSGLKVYPYRLADGGRVVLRAKVLIDLTPLTKLTEIDPEDCGLLRRELMIDLFDPPQRVVFREQIAALRAEGNTEKQVSEQFGITITAAQRSSALNRLMQERNLTDPYLPVAEPPADYTKLRRHLHKRYRFEPLADE